MYNDKIIITYNFTSLTPIKTRDTMLKEAEDVECEINKQLDTAIKNDNVSYKNSCLPPNKTAFAHAVLFFMKFLKLGVYTITSVLPPAIYTSL